MQDLNGFSVPKGFRGAGGIKVQLWWAVQATFICLVTANTVPLASNFLLRLFGAKIGKNVVIRPSVKITYPWKLTLGDYAWVGMTRCYIPWARLRLARIRWFHRNVICAPAATTL